IQNSFIHNSSVGVFFALPSGAGCTGSAAPSFALINDTILGNIDGIHVDSPDIRYFNNIIDGNTLGVDILSAVAPGAFGNNAPFDNGTDSSGAAGPGAGYVTADPLLDMSTSPPGLLPGSPARGAALPAQATTHDYWGRPRDPASPDIGAIQSSP